jgi:sortase A
MSKKLNSAVSRIGSRLLTLIIIVLFCTSLWQLVAAGWIQGKAIIAQQLLDHAWQKTQDCDDGEETYHHKPWPWADTWPVAKLSVPRLGIEQIVVAGDSGNSLAFAPGYSYAGAAPGDKGLTMISAHRDTHFRFLQQLDIGDSLMLQTRGKTAIYRISHFQIVNSDSYTLAAQTDENLLVLVTCYPFDTITTGGSQRFLVFAMELQDKTKYTAT